MMERMKVMLVDDDDNVRKVVERLIRKEAYDFCYAANGEDALEMYTRENPDIIILDVMLPEIDGFEVCRRIREKSSVPIILLSAKGDIVDKSVGFNMGADDYITRSLSARWSWLCASRPFSAGGPERRNGKLQENKNVIMVKDLEIDCKGFEVKVRGRKADLTSKEFELLCFMARHPGQVFTREQLFDNLWDEKYVGDTGTITVFIRKIREKN